MARSAADVQARRAFLSYLTSERPGRRSPMAGAARTYELHGKVHYNSWYDFYSYQAVGLNKRVVRAQDEGFNGGFKETFVLLFL